MCIRDRKIGGKYSIDTQDILSEIEEVLEEEDMECWILFDKIDELFSNDYQKRKLCIESLFRTYLNFVNRFPKIKFKIFLRNDIWTTLEFVNKSHISDKCVELYWNEHNLLELLLSSCLLYTSSRQLLLRMDQWFLHRIKPGFAYDQ